MRLDLSDFNWINAVLGALILYRGIRDLYNGTGSRWRYEDEKKNFYRFYGIVSILCGVPFCWWAASAQRSSPCALF